MTNALRHRDYRVFFSGSMVTRMGEDMQEVAEDWLVFVMTGSPFLLGLVAFCKGPSRVLATMIFRSTGLSVIHLNVPNEFSSRAMGLYNVELGFRSLGALFLGSIGSIAGVPVAIATGSACFGLVSLLTPYYRRHFDRRTQVRPLSTPGD